MACVAMSAAARGAALVVRGTADYLVLGAGSAGCARSAARRSGKLEFALPLCCCCCLLLLLLPLLLLLLLRRLLLLLLLLRRLLLLLLLLLRRASGEAGERARARRG